MKKIIMSTLSLIAISVSVLAQGIDFEKGNWKETIAKAKTEHKTIYLDIYTTWCGPCKMMAKNYFPNEEIGKIYNKEFVNVSIDAEKGEGLDIAKKYMVTGYPTNLFIDPSNEEIIFKTMGMPGDKEGFIQNATTALLEKNDPMKLADYEKKFTSNTYDEPFLKNYIEKLNRLDANRDKQIDAYVSKYAKTIKPESLAEFLIPVTNTMNNKGFDFLVSDKKYTANYIKDKNPYNAYIERLMYSSLEDALNNNNESNFINSLAKYKKLMPLETEKYAFYKKNYYSKAKDEEKQWTANIEYADILILKSPKKYEEDDKKQLDEIKASILSQLKQKEMPEDKHQAAIDNTLKANPSYQHLTSSSASTQLNEIAWNAFEEKRSDKAMISKALAWAKKAVDLSENDDISSQLAVKDTYASLLYANGKKQEAIELESSLIEIAKKEKLDGVDSFEETLQKMKDGKY